MTLEKRIVLEMASVLEAQEKQPMMAAVEAYMKDNVMPRDKLTRIRVLEQALLEQAHMYDSTTDNSQFYKGGAGASRQDKGGCRHPS